ncbi:protein canopy homolog 4-like isoform X1 [Anneissia japonica]|uniref:protein canopy homolog 4-like isoform X1 n=1 Tax=Anneissia japonica TaxID=1529436 RepID=UPI0014257BBA|nr:protein canopy homolog 4-like isoform X1 [Anneissia japonica]
MRRKGVIFVFIVVCLISIALCEEEDEDDPTNPHRDPSKCEVCKYVVTELEGNLLDTSKTHEVFKIGHEFDKEKKEVKYTKSLVRLIEVLEGVCDRIMNYNIHAERESSRRLAKGTPETMQTLKDLRNKGVKVDLGIPDDMWDIPSAPVYKMKQYCDTLIETYEQLIEEWYFDEPSDRKDLTTLLCIDNYLPKGDDECLKEVWTGKEKVNFENNQKEEDEKIEKEKEEKNNSKKGKNKKNSKKEKKKGDQRKDKSKKRKSSEEYNSNPSTEKRKTEL